VKWFEHREVKAAFEGIPEKSNLIAFDQASSPNKVTAPSSIEDKVTGRLPTLQNELVHGHGVNVPHADRAARSILHLSLRMQTQHGQHELLHLICPQQEPAQSPNVALRQHFTYLPRLLVTC